MSGKFISAWSKDAVGIRSAAQITNMMSLCAASVITDLYVQVAQEDLGTADTLIHQAAIDYDPIADLMAKKGSVKIHAWFTTLLVGKDNSWTRNHYDKDWLFECRGCLYLNPEILAVQDFVVKKVKDTLDAYSFDGVVIERLKYPWGYKGDPEALTKIIQRIRDLTKLPISVSINCPELDGADTALWLKEGYIDSIQNYYGMLFR